MGWYFDDFEIVVKLVGEYLDVLVWDVYEFGLREY